MNEQQKQSEEKNYYLYAFKFAALTERVRKLQVQFNREHNIRESVPIFFKTKQELLDFISKEIDKGYNNTH